MEKEIFELQVLKFTLKTPTFERQKKIIALNKKIRLYLIDNIKENLIELDKYIDNPKSVEYMYAKNNHDLKILDLTTDYYYNKENLQEIFELLLDGDLGKIDYDGDADELVKLASNLSEKFFFTSNKKQEN